MAIQTRRGSYDDFDPAKMLPGELATVTSGDPGADDGRSVYACFAAGDVKRMATYEDMQENISQATQDIQEDFTAQLTQKISQADTAIFQAQSATSAANTAAQGADEAKQEALDAAEEAKSYVLGDISNKTVSFSEASTRGNINTGESTSTLFGKIKKWFSDLGAAAFHAVANNLTTTTEGSVLDARQGKVLGDAINQLNTNLNNKQDNLGYTPVQQGGGAGQGANKVYIGWANGRLKTQVDALDLGNMVFDSNMNNALANYVPKNSGYKILSVQTVVVSVPTAPVFSQATGTSYFNLVSGATQYLLMLKCFGWWNVSGAEIVGNAVNASFINCSGQTHAGRAVFDVIAIAPL